MEDEAETTNRVLEVWITTLERNDKLALLSDNMVARLPQLVSRFNPAIGPLYDQITVSHNLATYSLPAVDVVVAVELMKWFEDGMPAPLTEPDTTIAFQIYKTVYASRYYNLVKDENVRLTLSQIKLQLGGQNAVGPETNTSLVCALLVPYLLNSRYGNLWGNPYLHRPGWVDLVADLYEAGVPATTEAFRARGRALRAWETHLRQMPTAQHARGGQRVTTTLAVTNMVQYMQGILTMDEVVVTLMPLEHRGVVDTMLVSAYGHVYKKVRDRKTAMGDEFRRQYRRAYPDLVLSAELAHAPSVPSLSERSLRRHRLLAEQAARAEAAGQEPEDDETGTVAGEQPAEEAELGDVGEGQEGGTDSNVQLEGEGTEEAVVSDTGATGNTGTVTTERALDAGEATAERSSADGPTTTTIDQEVEEAARRAVRHVCLEMANSSAVLMAPPPAELSAALDCQEELEGAQVEPPGHELPVAAGDKRTHHQAFDAPTDEMSPGRLSPLYLALQRYGRPTQPDERLSVVDYRTILTRLMEDCADQEEQGSTTARSRR